MITPTLFRKKPHLASTSSLLNSSEKLPTRSVVAVFPKCRATRISLITHSAWHRRGAWGKRSRRNGVVLFVFIQDRKMFIQVGYGLEGALPDADGIRHH